MFKSEKGLLLYFAIVAVFAILVGTIFYTVFIYDHGDDNLAGMADYELDDLFGNEIDATGSEWTFEDFSTDEQNEGNLYEAEDLIDLSKLQEQYEEKIRTTYDGNATIGKYWYKNIILDECYNCEYIKDHWECSKGE